MCSSFHLYILCVYVVLCVGLRTLANAGTVDIKQELKGTLPKDNEKRFIMEDTYITPPFPVTSAKPCRDLLPNCDSYGKSACVDYRPWAMQRCQAYCGFCEGGPTTTPAPCVDTIPNCNEYQGDTCTNPLYLSWAEKSCRKFCNLCGGSISESTTLSTSTTATPASTTPSTAKPCLDSYSNCASYGKSACVDYRPWAIQRCQAFCGFCQGGPTTTPIPCVDTIPNCNEYQGDTCTNPSYRSWAKKHCIKSCNLCGGSAANSTTIFTTSSTSPATSTLTQTSAPTLISILASGATSLTTSSDCVDLIDCSGYDLSACSGDYKPWAMVRCRAYCGFCDDGRTTTAEVCRDKSNICNQYQRDICTNPLYKKWSKENCIVFCDLCQHSGSNAVNGTTMTTVTGPETTTKAAECVDLIDCNRFGPYVCFGAYKAWATVRCPAFCGFCDDGRTSTPTPPCVDMSPICSQYQADACTNPSYKTWAKTNCRAFCKLCHNTTTAVPKTTANSISTSSNASTPTQSTPEVQSTSANYNMYSITESTPIVTRSSTRTQPSTKTSTKSTHIVDGSTVKPSTTAKLSHSTASVTVSTAGPGTGTKPITSTGGPVTTGGDNCSQSTHVQSTTSLSTPDIAASTTELRTTPTTHRTPGTTYIAIGINATVRAPLCDHRGRTYKQGEKWFEACDFACECMDGLTNNVLCGERCPHWNLAPWCVLKTIPGECCPAVHCSRQ